MWFHPFHFPILSKTFFFQWRYITMVFKPMIFCKTLFLSSSNNTWNYKFNEPPTLGCGHKWGYMLQSFTSSHTTLIFLLPNMVFKTFSHKFFSQLHHIKCITNQQFPLITIQQLAFDTHFSWLQHEIFNYVVKNQ